MDQSKGARVSLTPNEISELITLADVGTISAALGRKLRIAALRAGTPATSLPSFGGVGLSPASPNAAELALLDMMLRTKQLSQEEYDVERDKLIAQANAAADAEANQPLSESL